MRSLFEILNKPNFLFDSHCHLNSVDYAEDLEVVLDAAISFGVKMVCDISVDLESSRKSLDLSRKYKQVKSFVGIDPDIFIPSSELALKVEADEDWFETAYLELDELITQNTQFIAGIGETGMDYYWLSKQEASEEVKQKSYRLQEKLYRIHLELAQMYDLPLSIHSRFAERECLEIASNYNAIGILHSYTGGYKTAVQALDRGFGLGVNGIVTYKSAVDLRKIYKKILGEIPKDVSPDWFYRKGIYFETDAPFLSPEGKRGERNEPQNIKIIYDSFVESLRNSI